MRQRTAILLSLGAGAGAASPSSGSEQSWTSPQETDVAFMVEQQLRMGSSPKPTPPPQPRGHHFARMDLMPRLEGYTLDPGTCGFVQFNGVTCVSSTATCASLSGYLGCCERNKVCSRIQTVCIDYVASQAGKCDLPYDYHTVCCMLHLFDDKAWLWHFHGPCMLYLQRTESPTTTVAAQTRAATETGNGAGGGGGGGSQANVGAIAGGAVGGVAVLGLLGVVAFLLLRRRRSHASGSDTQQASPQTAMAQSHPQNPPQYPHTYSPPAQNYDPHMSVYSQQAYPPQGWNNQYPQQLQGQYPPQQPGGYQPYGAASGFAAPSTASPPPPSVPSPNTIKEGEEGPHGVTPPPAAPHHHQPSELAAVAPLGYENNRAELN
ncbi:hypothetical protein HRG_005843 [Hirsutella rhossiliensis]|uniref:Uncharacterized protein n=1 Tax=Hirsutella rhossiliensis TaxID=111463 RepID=A0A9P8SHP0_9HYPO|nr:uncharacterized protein HRG_05843 [Hirsutella rhossiliensis]KAH0963333.1 hypothetical protein HRG_05843 [Hirsutella rhossiliensis]